LIQAGVDDGEFGVKPRQRDHGTVLLKADIASLVKRNFADAAE
jgi:hypothetical protein